MSNHPAYGGSQPGSPLAIRRVSRKDANTNLKVPIETRPRSLSASTTTTTSGSRLSETASEGGPSESSQTEVSSQEPQWQDLRELVGKPLGKLSPIPGPFFHGRENVPPSYLQDDVETTFEELIESASLSEASSEEDDPKAVKLLHLALHKDHNNFFTQAAPKASSRLKPLNDRLTLAAVKSCGPDSSRFHQSFYPPTVLGSLLDIPTVQHELRKTRKWSPERIEAIAATICPVNEELVTLSDGKETTKSFRPIFALLVLTDQVGFIECFIDEDVTSLDLPLSRVADENGDADGVKRRNTSNGITLRCFSTWPLHKREDFCVRQWQFVAHPFQRSEYDQVPSADLDDLTVLPFVTPLDEFGRPSSEGVVSLGEGGSGHVMRCYIHRDYHNFSDKDNITKYGVAVKRLKNTVSDDVFKRELKILRKFCGVGSHEHIVSLLAAYKQSDHYHLIFPLAKMNLFEYWKENRQAPNFDYEGVVWIAKQCAGITKALSLVHAHKTPSLTIKEQRTKFGRKGPSEATKSGASHSRKARSSRIANRAVSNSTDWGNIQGLHGDIKPENVLLFLSDTDGHRGVMKLSDFGEAEMTPSARGSRTRPNAAVTLTYRAPECDLRPDSVRPASDVWALGCVLLEWVTWMLGGFKSVEQFGKRRLKDDIFDDEVRSDTFFEFAKSNSHGQVRLGVRVKPEVINFIEDLHSHRNCTDFLHDLLDIIQDRMLLVDSEHRKQCNFHTSLCTLYENCDGDSLYATEARPRKRAVLVNSLLELQQCDIEEKQSAKISYNMHRIKKHSGMTKRSTRGGRRGPLWKPRVLSF